ncbi:MAG: excinuclease ABC subunit UvrA [Nitrospirae bacterium]|nr:excinuclease ABC subunit UvrA [Nitrospirota bacterium]MCL5422160.1 excinuclease ABC subunit UvrA [Nitrospirota bacterium]
MQDRIIIKGAREHNLKNVDVTMPREKITVITGPSGSGKSSLAIDTVYAEGQRRYVESLSAYARQFLDQLQKPDVDFIEGLSPSIAINQKTVTRSPRSTLGTITEIYDYMRVLYTRIGRPFCYNCGGPISTRDVRSIIDSVMSMPQGTRLQVLAPIVRDRKGEYRRELAEMRSEGFVRARIDGRMVDLTEEITLRKQKRHTIEIVIDRLIIKHGIEKKIKSAIDVALGYSDTVMINLVEEEKDIPFSKAMACLSCGISFPEINPRLFSFNSGYGACPLCHGLGVSGLEKGIDPFRAADNGGDADLSPEMLKPCKSCGGMRLREEALSIKIQDMNIGEFSRLTVDGALSFVNRLALTERERTIASRVLKEVKDRLSFLIKVGLGYLTLDRMSLTLSGGEAQRIRLATQMGSSLTGVLYVLDEPSIGLHPRDCTKLLESLSSIRDAGNTILVVEHDEETIRWADHVIDIGPGAGARGGWIVAEGTPSDIQDNERSVTGKYLKGELAIPLPMRRRRPADFIHITGAQEFNLKNIDVHIPLGTLTCVTGVSGSGKSTLIIEILYKALMKSIHKSVVTPGKHRALTGADKIDNVICVDQSPLGRTPRSNPATYAGVFSPVRELYAQVQESRIRGFSSSRFSFNVPGGRCEKCHGGGLLKVAMHFLPDAYVQCDTCKGRRYNKETLNIKFKGRDISEVLSMTVSEALEFFASIPAIKQKLEILEDVGLGYLQLGQPAPTLSGGEAQRLRLSRELAKRATGNTLYILDEPTTGLHFIDIQRLLDVLNSLVDRGNTVIVVEHNLDVIKSADYLIDLGPEGGENGGRLIAAGTPEDVSRNPHSHTGRFLRQKLAQGVARVA